MIKELESQSEFKAFLKMYEDGDNLTLPSLEEQISKEKRAKQSEADKHAAHSKDQNDVPGMYEKKEFIFAASKPKRIAPLVQAILAEREQKEKDKGYRHDNQNNGNKKKKNKNKNKQNNGDQVKGQLQKDDKGGQINSAYVNGDHGGQHQNHYPQRKDEQSKFTVEAREFIPMSFSNNEGNGMVN